MSKIIPFKAVRPTRDKVALVVFRSYQNYTKSELEAHLAYNPFSFLHVVNPYYKYDKQIIGQERYNLVKNRYQEFKEDSILILDKKAIANKGLTMLPKNTFIKPKLRSGVIIYEF